MVERTVVVTDPGKAIYKTIIPNQVQVGDKRYCCAPVKASPTGGFEKLPAINTSTKKESATLGTAVGSVDVGVQAGLTYDAILQAQRLADQILSGVHHVSGSTLGAGTAYNQINVVEDTTIIQPETVSILPLVDIEKDLRSDAGSSAPVGFQPVGGSGSRSPRQLLDTTDSTRLAKAEDLIADKSRLATGENAQPADQINKFSTSDPNLRDVAVVSNDHVLLLDENAPGSATPGVMRPRSFSSSDK
jgi:hypothetical protein